MKRASVAAGPRIGCDARRRWRRARRCPATAASTSSLVTRPRGPVPVHASRSSPCARRCAPRRAWRSRRRCRRGSGAGSPRPARASGCRAVGAAPAPAAIRHSTVPDGDRLVRLDQDLGDRAGDGRGQLGVDLVGGDLDERVVDCDRVAHLHAPLEHRALGDRVAHLREGDVDELAVLLRRRLLGAAGRGRRGRRRPPRSRRAPSPPGRSRRPRRGSWSSVPAAGAGTSASTLSVEISTSGSSASTRSPTCFSHSSTVPSVTDSPIWGMVIWTLVARVAIPTLNCSLTAIHR